MSKVIDIILFAAIAEAGRLLTPAGPFSGGGSVAAFDLTEGETFGSSDAGQSFVPKAAVGPGVWSDGTTMWIGGVDTNKLYAFNMTETRTGGL